MEDSELIEIYKILKKTSSSTFDLLVNLLEWSQFQSGDIEYTAHLILSMGREGDDADNPKGPATLSVLASRDGFQGDGRVATYTAEYPHYGLAESGLLEKPNSSTNAAAAGKGSKGKVKQNVLQFPKDDPRT